jgi:uncharacterized protein YecE (DUF72 family)
MGWYVGTSGYSYKEWKGHFYPDGIAQNDMLAYYAGRLPCVEINNTFYRMPQVSVLETWRDAVPDDFRFVIKASQRITHRKRLKDAEEPTGYLLERVTSLEEKLGALLFQMPPHMRKDLERLERFLALIPRDVRAAFEFRHPSWFEDDVFECLTLAGAALCVADGAKEGMPSAIDLPATGPWGYYRLRQASYSDADLAHWLARMHELRLDDCFVFFKHEDEAAGPRLAERFLELATPRPARRARRRDMDRKGESR